MTFETYTALLHNFGDEAKLRELGLRIHFTGFFRRPEGKQFGWKSISQTEFEFLYNKRNNLKELKKELNSEQE